jgi:hypothetical protein
MLTKKVSCRLWVLGLAIVSALPAAELQKETLGAWEQQVRAADSAMSKRVLPGHPFLWIDEAPNRRQQLRDGEFLISKVGTPAPQKVPFGLIHHWVGAAFFPNVKLEDVLAVVRDYTHYKDYYKPNVIDSQMLRHTAGDDQFSMLIMNKALFLKMALAGEYEARYAQAASNRWYSIASTSRLQEVEGYGESNERKLPEDEGSGYVWRMHSIARYEESDGGVYVEMETMALSRDIPAALRWMVDPIVQRVAKSAMTTSLRQTQDAVISSSRTASATSFSRNGSMEALLPASRR